MTIDQYAGDTIAADPRHAGDSATETVTPAPDASREATEVSQPRRTGGAAMLLDLIGGDESNWREDALCAQTDPESFYPEKGGSTREAKKVCASCEVRAECLDEALANQERFGIWGGLSERERRKLQVKLDGGANKPAAVTSEEPTVVTGEVIATIDDVQPKGVAA